MTNWYDALLVILWLGGVVFLLTLTAAFLLDDLRRWWEDAGQMILILTLLCAILATPLGVVFAESAEERAERKLRATIGVKIAEHPDGSEVWRVVDGSKWAVYLKPKGSKP